MDKEEANEKAPEVEKEDHIGQVLGNTSDKKMKFLGLTFEGTLEIIPAAAAIIISLGLVYINAYYYYGYDFKVATYLDISEILLLSFVDVGQIFDRTFFSFFALIFGVNLFIWINRVRSKREKDLLSIDELYLGITVPMILKEIFSIGDNWVFILLLLLSVIMTFVIRYLRVIISRNFNLILLAVLCLLEGGKANYSLVREHHYTFGTKLITEKDTINSDYSYYYVGKTTNFVFWYSEKDTAMTVIPMSDVKKLVIHNGVPDKKFRKLPAKPIIIPNRDTLVRPSS